MTNYTDEKQVLILISLLKAHGVKRIIISPGATNVTLVGSIQNDSFFEIYSCVDERSAGYMATGMAAETGEPVALSCTGATASRNYMPALTEAFYRKLPVLAITSTQDISKIGHHVPQVIDRSVLPKDTVKYSVALPIVKDEDDWWDCEVKANTAILELSRNGGGPVHINLPTLYSRKYNTNELPKVRKINRISIESNFPKIPIGRVAIMVGSHRDFTNNETKELEKFCEIYNGVILCDHTSSYYGKYRMQFALVAGQLDYSSPLFVPDLVIQLGEISGDYYTTKISGREIWRVNQDGEIRDIRRKLSNIFEMPILIMLQHYNAKNDIKNISYYAECFEMDKRIREKLPVVPFSNVWIANVLSSKIPSNSVIHFGILHSLRAWNFFPLPQGVRSASNVGGFGIDGCCSSLIGASLVNNEKLYFGVVGDLAFFYDLNSIGNRHIRNNLRILMVNNGKGTEFRNFDHPANSFGERANDYMAAANHFGNQSRSLVRSFAENLGFEYISASSKEEFERKSDYFTASKGYDQPIVFEVFTNSEEESVALKAFLSIEVSIKGIIKSNVSSLLSKKSKSIVKKIIKG